MSDDAALRARWRDLVERRLPAAARERQDWPVSLDHCFARVLLDNAVGRPWREVVRPPAWRTMPADALSKAIGMGERVLAGEADLTSANNRSLEMRGRPRRAHAPLSASRKAALQQRS